MSKFEDLTTNKRQGNIQFRGATHFGAISPPGNRYSNHDTGKFTIAVIQSPELYEQEIIIAGQLAQGY